MPGLHQRNNKMLPHVITKHKQQLQFNDFKWQGATTLTNYRNEHKKEQYALIVKP